MSENEQQSGSTAKIAKALCAAQGDFPAIDKKRTADAGTYHYNYADLADIRSAVQPVLSEHGLAVSQVFGIFDEHHAKLCTLLLHDSGESIVSEIAFATPSRPQELGSLLTYLRRYQLCAILGVSAEEDDDGQGAQRAAATAAPARTPEPKPRSGGGSGALPAGWLEEPIKGGKFDGQPWSDLLEGDAGGGREQWMEYCLGDKRTSTFKRQRIEAIMQMRGAGAPPEVGRATEEELLAFSKVLGEKADACMKAWGDRWAPLMGGNAAEMQASARRCFKQLILENFAIEDDARPATVFGEGGSAYGALDGIVLGEDGVPIITGPEAEAGLF